MNRQDTKIAKNFNLRRATIDDAELLARLNEPVQQIHYEARPDIFKPPASTPALIADFRDHLAQDDVCVFIGEADGEPIGYILALIRERLENPYCYGRRELLIDQISINPEQRSRGYGEQLMRHVYALAKSLDIQTVMIGVWAFNERAIHLYEKQGFTARDIHMELHLEQT